MSAYGPQAMLAGLSLYKESIMRLDKYLKVSRIIKRRTVANEACSGGRVTINGKVAKPGAEVKPGDELTIRFGDRLGRYEIVSIQEHVRKEGAADMYRVLSEDAQVAQERDA
jgi:ribosomal 50S subunit-recycling heat shock protein